jgi:hypothetical protein
MRSTSKVSVRSAGCEALCAEQTVDPPHPLEWPGSPAAERGKPDTRAAQRRILSERREERTLILT